jgi:hypothetical protein
MPNAAVVAAALTDHSAHPFGLFIGGLDVIAAPGTQGQRVGVQPESIHVTEAGPGVISAMTFTVDDPGKAIALTDGLEVTYWDLVNNVPLFGGFLLRWSLRPDPGGQGRKIDVECSGFEALLDRVFIDTWTFPNNTKVATAIQALAGNFSDLRAFVSTASDAGAQATPVGWLRGGIGIPNSGPYTITSLTLRQAIARLFEICMAGDFTSVPNSGVIYATVDFYKGLRVWCEVTSLGDVLGSVKPDDYTNLTVADTTAGAFPGADLEYAIDTGELVRKVYIQGGNAAGTGWVTDGTGKPGATAYINDSSIVDANRLAAVGAGYIASHKTTQRGSVVLAYAGLPTTVHPGSAAIVTDAAVDAAGASLPIVSIEKTWHGTEAEWTVTFGTPKPSTATAIRDVTRSTPDLSRVVFLKR